MAPEVHNGIKFLGARKIKKEKLIYRNDKLSRILVGMIAIAANIFLPMNLFPREIEEILFLAGLLILIDVALIYFILQTTIIEIESDKVRLVRKYFIKWIKIEETVVDIASIFKINRIRGNKGGPRYSIHFKNESGKEDKVTVTSWDIEDPGAMAEELSRRSRIPITNSWFYG